MLLSKISECHLVNTEDEFRENIIYFTEEFSEKNSKKYNIKISLSFNRDNDMIIKFTKYSKKNSFDLWLKIEREIGYYEFVGYDLDMLGFNQLDFDDIDNSDKYVRKMINNLEKKYKEYIQKYIEYIGENGFIIKSYGGYSSSVIYDKYKQLEIVNIFNDYMDENGYDDHRYYDEADFEEYYNKVIENKNNNNSNTKNIVNEI